MQAYDCAQGLSKSSLGPIRPKAFQPFVFELRLRTSEDLECWKEIAMSNFCELSIQHANFFARCNACENRF
jgi:hypothetical protein